MFRPLAGNAMIGVEHECVFTPPCPWGLVAVPASGCAGGACSPSVQGILVVCPCVACDAPAVAGVVCLHRAGCVLRRLECPGIASPIADGPIAGEPVTDDRSYIFDPDSCGGGDRSARAARLLTGGGEIRPGRRERRRGREGAALHWRRSAGLVAQRSVL